MSKRGIRMTAAQAEVHQRKHGFVKSAEAVLGRIMEPYEKAMLSLSPKPRMNKTESEYALILEAMTRRGEILRYEYEGITLRWADMKYTPDFILFSVNDPHRSIKLIEAIKLIEVKGAHIWDRDIVRFKGARAYWPEFQFEMWQRRSGVWRRIQ